MTTYNRQSLKTFFETGDIPFGIDYANLIDSCLNIVDTSAQTIASPLQTPELIASRISASNVNITGTLSAASIYIGSISLSAGNAFIGGNLKVSGSVSARNVNVSGAFNLNGIITTTSAVTRNTDTSARQTNIDLLPADTIEYRQYHTTGHAYNSTLTVRRFADYNGGSAAWVNSGLNVRTDVSATALTLEWALVGQIHNSSTGGENVGVYGQGNALTTATGPTFGMVAQVNDKSNSDRARASIGLEVDCFANGVNTVNRNRLGIQVVAGTYNLGTAAEIWAGLYFTNYDRAYYNNVIHIGNDPAFPEPTFGVTTGIRVTNVSGTTMLYDDATWVNGIKLVGNYSGDALIVSGKVSATSISILNDVSASGTVYASAVRTGTLFVTGGVSFGAVSAASLNVSGTISAASLNVTGDILAATGRVTASAMNVSTAISAASLNVTGDVSAATGSVVASALRSPNGVFYGSTVPIVSAAGTTQAAAAIITGVVMRGQGVTDGAATGFAIPANKAGWIQTFNYESAVSANLWPPTGGQINNLGVNGVYVLNPRTMYQIVHIAASSYAVGSFFSIG